MIMFVYVVTGVLKLAPIPDKTNNDIQKTVCSLFHFNDNVAEFSPDFLDVMRIRFKCYYIISH